MNPYLCEADQQGSWQSANDGEAEFGSMLILERRSRDLRITNPAIITLLPGDSSTTLKILNTILEMSVAWQDVLLTLTAKTGNGMRVTRPSRVTRIPRSACAKSELLQGGDG